ncbi:MAG TPA: nitroreductase, partial [Caldilineaceae bacterium]|nr:nitroreductase [Caldilineaceae bacterium]
LDLLDAIYNRRTIKDFRPDRVPDEVLERVLNAGPWAQNHHLTQPWRFILLGPQTHRAWAKTSAELQLQSLRTEDAAAREKARAGAEQKILAKPRLVAVTYRLCEDAQQRREDFAATCCAIQLIQLAAWAEGLGMQWSTNFMTRHPQGYALLGIDPAEEEMVGLLYFGYPAEVPAPRARKPLAEVLRRLP